MKIKVIDIYRAYPDSDLLPYKITEETTCEDLKQMDYHDRLFEFLCYELCREDIEPDDAINRCFRASLDVQAVRKRIHKMIDEQSREPADVVPSLDSHL